jgi:hypothetical protein
MGSYQGSSKAWQCLRKVDATKLHSPRPVHRAPGRRRCEARPWNTARGSVYYRRTCKSAGVPAWPFPGLKKHPVRRASCLQQRCSVSPFTPFPNLAASAALPLSMDVPALCGTLIVHTSAGRESSRGRTLHTAARAPLSSCPSLHPSRRPPLSTPPQRRLAARESRRGPPSHTHAPLMAAA